MSSLTRTLSRTLSRTVVRAPLSRPLPSLQPILPSLSQRRNASSKHPKGFTPPSQSDLAELRERVQDFVRREIPEEVAAATDKSNNFPADMWQKLGDAGLLGITADEDVGGLGMGYQAHCVVMEELSRASGSIALSYAAHSQLCVNQLQLNGTAEQKARFLPDLIAGRKVGALAMSESGSGSDVVSMRTRAVETEGGFLLTGSKMWITNGPDADLIIVYAKTKPDAGSKGITAFIVDTRAEGSKGFAVLRKLDKMGMRGSNTGELVFDNVFVPHSHVLGPVNGGVRVLMEGLDLERLVLSAGPLGLMQAALDVALPYAHSRKQFGTPIGQFQFIQGKLADMYTKLQASRSYTYATARAVDEDGVIRTHDCAGAILYAAERATECALDCIQILGGMGYTEDMPASRILRDAKLYEIGAGTSEVRRMVIGRAFNREYAHLSQ
ncbi:isovaleryl-CoA dehydrogenase-like protein [Thermochaetoides thermophila DSM 1495]|uniref:Isovaleryl-CoA dehydrogenase-like protein n=1 Tax=Chaetomium thermophilum (strain DSM 1495 / CBS 144.50 / IMI 039719) TaxID=759272 RepID=G0S1E5_CHATD|nr:isovaleryl-CoA dehydrogenase-like protein [Thermochaetoides thermophila DSM 1495]EGS22855.1 isovaleryl-CoA dehydrogenase-like protein [Thermochaetoides thermophila DSM 1495]